MTFWNWVFVSWAVVTTALVLVLVYRSTIAMKEDDQLFLDPAEKQLEDEQKQILKRLSDLKPTILALSAGSGALALMMLGFVLMGIWRTF